MTETEPSWGWCDPQGSRLVAQPIQRWWACAWIEPVTAWTECENLPLGSGSAGLLVRRDTGVLAEYGLDHAGGMPDIGLGAE